MPVTKTELLHSFRFAPRKPPLPPYQSLPDRTVYHPEQHGGIDTFCRSLEGKKLKQEFLSGIDEIGGFLLSRDDGKRSEEQKNHITESLDLFKDRVAQLGKEATYYSSHYSLIAGPGKYSFDRIVAATKNNTIRPDRVYGILADFPQNVTVCSIGTLTNLLDMAEKIDAATGGVEHAIHSAYQELADNIILEHVRKTHSHEASYRQYEIHYVNGYRNYFANRFAFKETEDPYVPPTVGDLKNLKRCENALRDKMSASEFINHLADRYLDCWKEHFPKKLPFEDTTSHKYEDMVKELQKRFDFVNVHDVAEIDENEQVFILRKDNTLLKRALARNLRSINFLESFKSATIVSSAENKLIRKKVKQVGDLFYLKTYDTNSDVERRPLQYSDFDNPWIKQKEAAPLLFPAAQLGHVSGIESLINAGANINAQCQDGYTPLMLAAKNGHPEAVELLLEHGADPRIKKTGGVTAISLAEKNGKKAALDVFKYDQVKKSINSKININAFNSCGENELMRMASGGHEKAIKLLLDAGANVNAYNNEGNTALMFAAANGHQNAVLALIRSQADVNVKNNIGESMLLLAAKYGHKDVVETLLRNGANASESDKFKNSALVYSAIYGHKEIVDILIRNKASLTEAAYGQTALACAAREGHQNIVAALIKAGADIPNKVLGLDYALSRAAGNGHRDVVATLIKAGADVNAMFDHLTPLMLAAEKNNEDVINALLAANARVNAATVKIAIRKGNREIVKALKKARLNQLLRKIVLCASVS